MGRRISILAISALVFAASCDKTATILENSLGVESSFSVEVGESAYQPQEQDLLMEALKNRRQISNIAIYNNLCLVSFSDGSNAHIRCDIFPFVRSGNGKTWDVNGVETNVQLQYDDDGSIIPPTLSHQTGVWYLDEFETTVPAAPYQEYDAGNPTAHLAGLLASSDRLYIYESDGSIASLPVIKDAFYIVPDYWHEHLVEKEAMAEAALSEAEGDCASFIFFTDTHWGRNRKKSPALIRHIVDFTPFDDVIFGGDAVTTFFADTTKPMQIGREFQAAFSFLGTNFHCVYGNHDDNSAGQPNNKNLHLSEEQVYSWLQSQMTDVVYGNYYNFYYDKPESRTRFICLDTGRYNNPIFQVDLPNTVAFAIDALASVPADWHVIMVSHIWCESSKQADGTYKQYLLAFANNILKVFDDYNVRSAGVYTYKTQSVPYDFSDAQGKIEFCIGGHTHGNFVTHSKGGIPVVIVISDSFQSPQRGTIKEQSVTMSVADFEGGRLRLFVVGSGADRDIELP